MLLRHVTQETFVLLRAEGRAHDARRLLNRLAAVHLVTHVIIKRAERRAYHLFTRQEAYDKLGRAPAHASVFDAFDLSAAKPAPEIAAHARVSKAPDHPCVVVEDGHLVGFFDGNLLLTGELASERKASEPFSLGTDFPDEVPVGETASLVLSLSFKPGDFGEGLSIPLAAGSRLDLIVRAGSCFQLKGSGEASLLVPSSRRDSPCVRFNLWATREGTGEISVQALHGTQHLGEIKLFPTVVAPPAVRTIASDVCGFRPLGLQESLGVVNVPAPDLSLLILESRRGDETVLDLRLTALDPGLGLNLARFGPIVLRVDPFRYFQNFFQDIENLTPGSTGQRKLSAKASYLFQKLFPPELQKTLWSLRGRIRSVQVQSEEPWIPWELCRLCGEEDGATVEGPFFCEQFTVTRWLPGTPLRLNLRLGRMAMVVPGDSELEYAQAERESIKKVSAGRWEVHPVPANYVDVCDAFASGKFDSWHFTGHGNEGVTDPDYSTIVLEGGQTLTPVDVSGVTSNLGRAEPLIFFNACRVGRGGLSLTGPGGWATQFLHAGAGVFIGTYWSVYDASAYEFAKSFYEGLARGHQIGEAVQAARLRAKIEGRGDSTWLAYTVFAHPLATLRPASTNVHG